MSVLSSLGKSLALADSRHVLTCVLRRRFKSLRDIWSLLLMFATHFCRPWLRYEVKIIDKVGGLLSERLEFACTTWLERGESCVSVMLNLRCNWGK
jgi:hypothetical protein